MTIIRPRLVDYYNIPVSQAEIDFAIPILDEDIPLHIDPFLLYKSPSLQDISLHNNIIYAFNMICSSKETNKSIETLIELSECDELGLGSSHSRKGRKIGEAMALDIICKVKENEKVKGKKLRHIEELQFYVERFGKDRISDITANLIKSFLIDYTIHQAEKVGLPLEQVSFESLFDSRTMSFAKNLNTQGIINPKDQRPILLTPKRWLRHTPWISTDEYFNDFLPKESDQIIDSLNSQPNTILDFNRDNYDIIDAYVIYKERVASDCKNDPLFNQIPITSAKIKFNKLKKLPSGNEDGNDKKYEVLVVQLMASLLYPHLDFAADQVRTDSGVSIRDLIFYNNRSMDFLLDVYDNYESKQLVLEMKNVRTLEREHIQQVNRYLGGALGKFGIILTRNPPSRAILKSTIDLWSGQRKCILILDDSDVEMMVNVFETKQRLPIEIVKRKYAEFQRMCPV